MHCSLLSLTHYYSLLTNLSFSLNMASISFQCIAGLFVLSGVVALIGAVPSSTLAPDDLNTVYYFQGGDEFPCSGGSTSAVPNQTIWTYDIGYIANNERQFYTASPSNNYIAPSDVAGSASCSDKQAGTDGFLHIVAIQNNLYRGQKQFNYTSSRLTTRGLACVQLGSYVEVRARVPQGRGTWPAIWLLGPTNIPWPTTGEIDIMEAVGYLPNRTFTTIHGTDLTQSGGTQIGGNASATTLYTDFHVYSSVWNASGIFFYTDNVSTFAIPSADITTWFPFTANRCYELLLNFAIGGDWGGIDGIDNSIFPVTFAVDYVRVFTSNTSTANQFWVTGGDNAADQTFALGPCGDTSGMGSKNYQLASLDRLNNPHFTPYLTSTPISTVEVCSSSQLFVGGINSGYLYSQPGGVGWDIHVNYQSGLLQPSNGFPIYSAAELKVYSLGNKAISTSCCVYYSTTISTTTASPQRQANNGPTISRNGFIAIGCGGALVVILIVSLILLMRRRANDRKGDFDEILSVDSQ